MLQSLSSFLSELISSGAEVPAAVPSSDSVSQAREAASSFTNLSPSGVSISLSDVQSRLESSSYCLLLELQFYDLLKAEATHLSEVSRFRDLPVRSELSSSSEVPLPVVALEPSPIIVSSTDSLVDDSVSASPSPVAVTGDFEEVEADRS